MSRILICDDSATDRCMVDALLSKDPALVGDHVENGVEALRAIKRQMPELIITDLVMPEMDGLELVEIVRRQCPDVPIILMTSQGNEEIAVEALQRGAASYVSKTKLAAKLLDTVHSVLAAAHWKQNQARLTHYLEHSQRRFVLENDAALFGPLLAWLQEEASRFDLWDDNEQTRVGIALQEALNNALLHGNLELETDLREADEGAWHAEALLRSRQPPYRDRRIRVAAEFTRREARFQIGDDGRGFDPTSLPDPTDPANLERASGRGVLLMRTFMDEVSFNPEGNVVSLMKRRSK